MPARARGVTVAAAVSTAAGLFGAARGADPSGGWLSYAVFKAPNPTDIVTSMSATMTVPDAPKSTGGSPAFWFGVQTWKGDGALVQPIMAKWLGDGFYMFQEIFDWTDMNDKQSTQIPVKPGSVVTAGIQYVKETNSYTMNMSATGQWMKSHYHYQLLPAQKATESVAYIVLEHQPNRCSELPPNGRVRWQNITIEVNGEPVANPVWSAEQENPACGSKATVIDSGTVDITWGQQ